MPNEINPDLFTKQVLNKFFPKAHLSTSTIWESKKIKPVFFDGEISAYNIFDQTPYEYKGQNSFIHFTSLEKLKAIIESGHLRMASLDSLQDTEEVHFAGKVIDPNCFYELDVASENLFSLSACESSYSNITNENMWMEYGDEHAGCILEYSFSKMELFRMNFGVIRYGEENLSDLKKLVSLSHSFYNEHGFSVSELPIFLRTILSFHKNQSYNFEREIRLLLEPVQIIEFHKDPRFETVFCDKKGIKWYFKIPFKEKNKLPENLDFDLETKLHHYPQIELKRIILGQNTSSKDLSSVRTLVRQNFPNSVIGIQNISESQLKIVKPLIIDEF
jgi:hypothetical protein